MTRKLNALAEEFENERERYRKLCEAVADKKQELETIYEVESAARDLVALIDAQRQRKEEFEASMARRKDELTQELTETREELEQARTDIERDNEERRKELEKTRKRHAFQCPGGAGDNSPAIYRWVWELSVGVKSRRDG